jgi:hypothetical protein
MGLVYVGDKELSGVFAELDGASKESFRRAGEFLSSQLGVSGVWSNLVSGTSVSRTRSPPPGPSDARLVGALSTRDNINSQSSVESSFSRSRLADKDTVKSQQS